MAGLTLPEVWDPARIDRHYRDECEQPVDVTAFGEERPSYVCGARCTDPVYGHTAWAQAVAEFFLEDIEVPMELKPATTAVDSWEVNHPRHRSPTMTHRLLAIAIAATAIMAILLGIQAASHADEPITIPIGTDHGAPGEVIPKGTHPAVAGDQCLATLTYTNNGPGFSEHPGTDILAGPVEWLDVEVGPGRTFDPRPFTATGPVPVAVRIGVDGVTSGGFTVRVPCTTPPTTTTTPATPTPSSVPTPTTTQPSTTSTPTVTPSTFLSPPPSGGVPAGGGGCSDGSCEPPVIVAAHDPAGWIPRAVLAASVVAAVALAGLALYRNWREGRP